MNEVYVVFIRHGDEDEAEIVLCATSERAMSIASDHLEGDVLRLRRVSAGLTARISGRVSVRVQKMAVLS